jgi:hypothetical protein
MSQISGNFFETDERSDVIPERAGEKPARSVIAAVFSRFLLRSAAFFLEFPANEH